MPTPLDQFGSLLIKNVVADTITLQDRTNPTNTVTLAAPPGGASYTFNVPTSTGLPGQILSINNQGEQEWITLSGISVSQDQIDAIDLRLTIIETQFNDVFGS